MLPPPQSSSPHQKKRDTSTSNKNQYPTGLQQLLPRHRPRRPHLRLKLHSQQYASMALRRRQQTVRDRRILHPRTIREFLRPSPRRRDISRSGRERTHQTIRRTRDQPTGPLRPTTRRSRRMDRQRQGRHHRRGTANHLGGVRGDGGTGHVADGRIGSILARSSDAYVA